MLVDDLIAAAGDRAGDRRLAGICIGVGYVAVSLDDGSGGAAYTFRGELGPGCNVVPEAGTIAGRPATELIEWARNTNLARAAVGQAVINALCSGTPGGTSGDVLAAIDFRSGDRVGMVGHFRPIADRLRPQVQELLIFERGEDPGRGILPERAAEAELPGCDVVLITATTLINKTIDRLLTLAGSAREVSVIGPSVPLLPDVFAGRGVTVLGGIRVLAADRLIQIVAEGGGVRSFGDAVQRVCFRLATGAS